MHPVNLSVSQLVGRSVCLSFFLSVCLFICFSTARMYADDTSITVSSKSTTRLHKELNHDLENIKNWLLANQLSFNVLKSEYVILSVYLSVCLSVFLSVLCLFMCMR